MSLRPGIGAGAMAELGHQLTQPGGAQALAAMLDVPAVVKCEGRHFSIGRYLRQRLRQEVGWEPGEPKRAKIARVAEAMSFSEEEIARRERSRWHGEVVTLQRQRRAELRKQL